jgi:CheY-like chemotaxis protein
MAYFLIIEPHEDVRRLYAAVVRGLGHEPVLFQKANVSPRPDVLLVEPAHAESFEVALAMREQCPDLPIVCASIYEPTEKEVHLLRATSYLLKPFSLVQLTDALEAAFAQCDGVSC